MWLTDLHPPSRLNLISPLHFNVSVQHRYNLFSNPLRCAYTAVMTVSDKQKDYFDVFSFFYILKQARFIPSICASHGVVLKLRCVRTLPYFDFGRHYEHHPTGMDATGEYLTFDDSDFEEIVCGCRGEASSNSTSVGVPSSAPTPMLDATFSPGNSPFSPENPVPPPKSLGATGTGIASEEQAARYTPYGIIVGSSIGGAILIAGVVTIVLCGKTRSWRSVRDNCSSPAGACACLCLSETLISFSEHSKMFIWPMGICVLVYCKVRAIAAF